MAPPLPQSAHLHFRGEGTGVALGSRIAQRKVFGMSAHLPNFGRTFPRFVRRWTTAAKNLLKLVYGHRQDEFVGKNGNTPTSVAIICDRRGKWSSLATVGAVRCAPVQCSPGRSLLNSKAAVLTEAPMNGNEC